MSRTAQPENPLVKSEQSRAAQTTHSRFLKPWVINILWTELFFFSLKNKTTNFFIGGRGELVGFFVVIVQLTNKKIKYSV